MRLFHGRDRSFALSPPLPCDKMKKKEVFDLDRRLFLRRFLLDLAVIGLLGLYLFWGNTSIGVSCYEVAAPGLPEEFSGFTIVQVSDLHNTQFGPENSRLLGRIAEESPDLIVLTGDLIDSNRTDLAVALDFAQRAAALAPTYFVQGNHDRKAYDELKTGLTAAGVTVLDNEAVTLERGGAVLPIIGLTDHSTTPVDESLTALAGEFSGFPLLLSHRPEFFGHYAGAGAGLVLSGHAHGGQFRLPLIGGLYAPGQGVFPTYDAGLHALGSTQMIVSRGLGNSSFPLRLNNRPELVVVELNPA